MAERAQVKRRRGGGKWRELDTITVLLTSADPAIVQAATYRWHVLTQKHTEHEIWTMWHAVNKKDARRDYPPRRIFPLEADEDENGSHSPPGD